MDALTLFGLVAVTAMLVFYALEDRSHWYILAFAAACGLASAYGFLQGAWPFGVVEGYEGVDRNYAGDNYFGASRKTRDRGRRTGEK